MFRKPVGIRIVCVPESKPSAVETIETNGIASHDLPLVVPNCLAFLVMGCTIAIALDKR